MKDVIIAVLVTAAIMFLFTVVNSFQTARENTVKDCTTTGFSRQGDVVIKCEVLDKGLRSR